MEVVDTITPHLNQLQSQLYSAVVKAIQESSRGVNVEMRAAIPIVAKPNLQDRIPGTRPVANPVSVYAESTGVAVVVAPLYANAYNFRVVQAIEKGGTAVKLTREGLFVHRQKVGSKGVGDPDEYVSFASAPRLQQWAMDHQQYLRHSVVLATREELSVFWEPIQNNLMKRVHREIAKRLQG